MASFYRKFIHGFSEIALPLHGLVKKTVNVKIDWIKEHMKVFEILKEKLITPPVLTHDDEVSQLELHTENRRLDSNEITLLGCLPDCQICQIGALQGVCSRYVVDLIQSQCSIIQRNLFVLRLQLHLQK